MAKAGESNEKIQPGLSAENFLQAFSEMSSDFDDADINTIFKDMDIDNNRVLVEDEFLRAEQAESFAEKSVKIFPLYQLLAAALPQKGFKRVRKADIPSIIHAVAVGIEIVLQERVDELERARAAGDRLEAAHSKYQSPDLSGTISDYHNGLAGRVDELIFISHFETM